MSADGGLVVARDLPRIDGVEPYAEGRGWAVYCGDVLDLVPRVPAGSVDAVVMDPPFAFAGGLSNGMTSQADDQFFRRWWASVWAVIAPTMPPTAEGFVWCDWRTAAIFAAGLAPAEHQRAGWRAATMLYHHRKMIGMGRPFRASVDQIIYMRAPKSGGARIPNTTPNLIDEYWYYGRHEHHPAEKSPVVAGRLVEWCSDQGGVVADWFMGSGTTGVAAIRAGRRFIGIDIDPHWCEVAAARLRAAEAQPVQLSLTGAS
jgi:site-specific DNA-methyltransferase (adenine-specific)